MRSAARSKKRWVRSSTVLAAAGSFAAAGDSDFADCRLQNRTLCRGGHVLSSLQHKPK